LRDQHKPQKKKNNNKNNNNNNNTTRLHACRYGGNGWFFQTGLVRQGHTTTQLSLTSLVWHHSVTGAAADFGQGELWIELSVWADTIAVELAWRSEYAFADAACTAVVSVSLISPDIAEPDGVATASSAVPAAIVNYFGGRVSLLLQARASDGKLVGGDDDSVDDQVTVTSTTPGAQVVHRTSATGDVVVEVPYEMEICGYSQFCATLGVMTVAVEATNPSTSEVGSVRVGCVRCCKDVTHDGKTPVRAHTHSLNRTPHTNAQIAHTRTHAHHPPVTRTPAKQRNRSARCGSSSRAATSCAFPFSRSRPQWQRSRASTCRCGTPLRCSPPESRCRSLRTGTAETTRRA
jgi:hypothetical protein